jgi:NCAIR mutase (PurE)-related protein
MEEDRLAALLRQVQEHQLTVEDALKELKHYPYEDLGFAKIDHHRALRQGFPEVVFCQGKTPQQAAAAFQALVGHNPRVLATRVRPHTARMILEQTPAACYHPEARLLYYSETPPAARWGKVAIVTAGTADIPVAEEAALTASLLENEVQRLYDVGVAGIHRLFNHMEDLSDA